MARGYCTPADVANVLGLTLTGPQQTYATALIGATETYIDQQTRRGWIIPPITGERYTLLEPTLYLRFAPVTSVQSVTWRTTAVGDTLRTLTAGTDYELFDPNLGQVNFMAGYSSAFGHEAVAFVSYTPNLPVPADIARATALIAAQSMVSNLYPDRFGIKSAQADEHTRVEYTVDDTALQIPVDAQRIIDAYVRPVIG